MDNPRSRPAAIVLGAIVALTSGASCDGQAGNGLSSCAPGLVSEACMCGGVSVASGYCCDAVPQTEACAVTVCTEGAVTSPCTCGAAVATAGYCCSGLAQTAECVSCVSGVPGANGTSGYTGVAMAAQVATFGVVLEVTPQAGDVEAGVGLAQGTQPGLDWTALATVVRFSSGVIDARNGDAYAASAAIPFASGLTYRVREEVDVASHRYSVFVTPPGGEEQALGIDYAFRDGQGAVTSLDQWGTVSDTGALDVCLVELHSVVVTVTPATATLQTNASQQFSATVTGTTNKAVSWSIDEGSSCGTLTAGGLYTAPASARTCHVTATSPGQTSGKGTRAHVGGPGVWRAGGWVRASAALAVAASPRWTGSS